MLYAIMKETYAWPVRKDAKPLEIVGPIAVEDGFEAAKERAAELSAALTAAALKATRAIPIVGGTITTRNTCATSSLRRLSLNGGAKCCLQFCRCRDE
jgi:hypothetical protein